MNKIPVFVTVSGPGTCINGEMHIIQKALEAVGYEVIVKNEHPDEKPFDYMKPTNPEAWVIHLEADHQPWGG